jgi:subtilase family serine protease
VAVLAVCGGAAFWAAPAGSAGLPVPVPAVAEYQFLSAGPTPPTEANCFAAGRRCFTATAMENSYNLPPLYAAGDKGQGVTIAIIDSFGNPNMASDLANFDTQMGLPHMCGEPGQACGSGTPTFQHLYWNGKTEVKAPPPNSKDPGLQARNAWALETSLDVEWAHAIAPEANILNVTTNPAETQGVQGFPTMMDAEQYVVDHHLANVISQSFASAEEAFGSAQSLQNLRHAFISAAANGVTVLGSSGDGGTANVKKTPVSQGGSLIPYPTVEWPASDPLVTGVGGTYLCTDPLATQNQPRTVDSADQPTACQAHPGQAEVAWIDAGGGFSHVFSRPAYQNTLPAGSTPIPTTQRGVPDIGLQASSRTGALVYVSLPPYTGLTCPGGHPCSTGWYDIGGTSLSCPQWAGLVAIADQLNGGGLGLINPALYKLAANPASYSNDFYDVTVGNNQADPSVPGYSASPGWDPVTGLGTPNAANLVPDLVAASH